MSTETDNVVADARHLFTRAVDAVRPSRIFASVDLNALFPKQAVGASEGEQDRPASLREAENVWVVAFGKAAIGMAGAAEKAILTEGGTVSGGVAIAPHGYEDSLPETERPPEHIRVMTADHPVAGEASALAGQAVLRVAQKASKNDVLLTLISGGGTALTTLPAEGLDVWDIRYTYKLLLASGANIHEMNAVRKHLTQLGGGQLAAATDAYVASLIVSDVPGDDLSVIASGPTVADSSTFEEAMRVTYQFGIWHDLPEPVRKHLVAGAHGRKKETPSKRPARGFQHLLATNETARSEAVRVGAELGYAMIPPAELLVEMEINTEASRPVLEGEARERGAQLATAWLEKLQEADRPIGCVLGGETTVTVTGGGTGGRNQELALSAALEWERGAPVSGSGGSGSGDVAILSAGTDGIDGPTDAAGAAVTPAAAARMRAAGVDPVFALDRNDSYAAHEAISSHVRTGPTHTNVMDLVVLLGT
jgi:hydroxypyruvate reductase